MSSGFQSVAQREAAPDRKAWLLVAFTWVAYCLNYRPASHLLDVSHSEIHTAFYGCAARADGRYSYGSTGLCWPIAGQIGDRFSKRRPVALSLLLWSGVTVLTGLSHSVGMVLRAVPSPASRWHCSCPRRCPTGQRTPSRKPVARFRAVCHGSTGGHCGGRLAGLLRGGIHGHPECGGAWIPGFLPRSYTLLQQTDDAAGDFLAKVSCHWWTKA